MTDTFDPRHPSNIDSITGKPRLTFCVGQTSHAWAWDLTGDEWVPNDVSAVPATLNMRVTSPVQMGDVLATLTRLYADGQIIGYYGGDSFFEWGEPFGHDVQDLTDGWAVHVVFVSHLNDHVDRATALAVECGVLGRVNACVVVDVDHDDMREIFEAPGRLAEVVLH